MIKIKKLPKTFISHLIIQFSKSLITFLLIMFALIILINFVEELFLLKDLNIKNNLYLLTFYYTMLKSPSLLINLLPFIFLFSGIHFFVKIIKNNEFMSLKISGLSNLFITLVPSIYSFFLGVFIILIISPLSSTMTKHYEYEKKNISGNQNLLIVNDNGIWIREISNTNETKILKIERISQGNSEDILKNISIFVSNRNGNLQNLIFAKEAIPKDDFWILKNAEYTNIKINEKTKYDEIKFMTKIKIDELNNIFSNTDTFSIWGINNYLKTLKLRGYYGDELIIKFHKYISFPFLIFATVIFSTIFTINMNNVYENYVYVFCGIVSGIIIYFILDLSIALGKSGRIPLIFSVWAPIILILILCLFNLIKTNEK